MTPAPLTAELCARALIAAAISYGEDPSNFEVIPPLRWRKVLAAGALGLHHATQRDVGDMAAVMGITRRIVLRFQNRAGETFHKAAEQAEIAGTYQIRSNRPEPVVRAATPPLYATPKSRLKPREDGPAKPARQASPAKLKVVPTSGATVIRLKPVTPSVAKHARQQLAKGAALEDLAEAFDVDPESLDRAVKASAA